MLFPGAETATPDTPKEALYLCVAGMSHAGMPPSVWEAYAFQSRAVPASLRIAAIVFL